MQVLSSDAGAHGVSGGFGFGIVFAGADLTAPLSGQAWRLSRLSEEHGWVDRSSAHDVKARDGADSSEPRRDLRVGDRVRIVPCHACPVANLATLLHVVGDDNSVAESWSVDARACVQ